VGAIVRLSLALTRVYAKSQSAIKTKKAAEAAFFWGVIA
jgi:hypothetical protein